MNILEILKISRPRFWLYEAATFGLIGVAAGANTASFLTLPHFWIFFLYFLISANILIYGINDIFDYETDKLNQKKVLYEGLITPDKRRSVWLWIIATTVPFLFFIPTTPPLLLSFGAFLFFAVFYSAPPIRAKALPFIDSFFSAAHYVATGVFGYYLVGGAGIPVLGVVAGMLWAIAMHAYSAIPDISADAQAGLTTTAIVLGKKQTIFFCWFLYLLAAVLMKNTIPVGSLIGGMVYSYLMWRSINTTSDEHLFKLYTYFPLVNTLVGAIISLELIARLVLFR